MEDYPSLSLPNWYSGACLDDPAIQLIFYKIFLELQAIIAYLPDWWFIALEFLTNLFLLVSINGESSKKKFCIS